MGDNSSLNQVSNPIPNPAPKDYQTATTYRIDNYDGSYIIYDKFSGNELYNVKADGTFTILGDNYANYNYINDCLNNLTVSNISYDDKKAIITINNSNNEPVLVIKNNLGIVEVYNQQESGTYVTQYDYNGIYVGREEHNKDGVVNVYSKEDIKTKTIYADGKYNIYKNGNTIMYDSANNKIKTLYADGSYEIYESDKTIKYDANSNEHMHIYKDGRKVYIKYDTDGNCYLHIYDDGKKVYYKSNKESLIIYPDGTFYNSIDNIKGVYAIDENGNIKCIDTDNNTYLYNSNGIMIKTIDNSGKIVNYDYDKITKTATQNGKEFVSKINHIEYDEKTYNNILTTLNKLSESNTNGLFSSIESSVNSFPDNYAGNIGIIKNSIKQNIKLISALKEMTNYSLLAYQACDNELKDSLNILIDALFEEKQSATIFKKSILYTIEDRDKDGILEYKLDTDFSNVSDNLIPTKTYIDENGNILYFNNNGKLLSHDGNNIKINYGGESFNLTFSKNGCAILKDANGNPINIFGDYNIDSCQYGGDQGKFLENGLELLNDKNINTILDRYFPNATYEEKRVYLNNISFTGCGFVAITNMTFKMMEGHEEDFQNNFGYPMYNIVYKDEGVSVDYNYEPLTLEFFSEIKGNDLYGKKLSIKEATNSGGMNFIDEYRLENYLINKYHVYDYNSDTIVNTVNSQGESYLYDLDGNIVKCGHHAMTVVDKTSDGKTYVSTWGKKYQYVLEENGYDFKETYPIPDGQYHTSVYLDGSMQWITYTKDNGQTSLDIKEREN